MAHRTGTDSLTSLIAALSNRKRVISVFGAVVLLLTGAIVALAVHENPFFELDGNTTTENVAKDDWDEVFNETDSALISDFNNDSAQPDSSHHEPSNADAQSLDDWGCVRKPNVNDKEDIQHAYAAAYDDGGDLFIAFGADRDSNNGSANIGVWFFQDAVGCQVGPAPTFADGSFTGNKTDGDVFIVSEFTNGGAVSVVNVYLWMDPDSDPLNNNECLGDGTTCGVALASGVDCQSEAFGGSDPDLASPDVCATVNGDGDGDNQADDEIDAEWRDNIPGAAFFEGGINLSNLLPDLDCFTSMLIETRSSPSIPANLHDLAFLEFDTCGSITAHKYLDTDGDGIDDGGTAEPGLEGWTIELYEDDNGNGDIDAPEDALIDSGTTDADGDIAFGSLNPGDYIVCEVLLVADPVWVNSDPGGGDLCEPLTVAALGDETVDFGNGQPDIDVTKVASAEDVCDGETVTYTITVTNTGNVNLVVDVSDDVLGVLDTDVLIEPGDSEVYTPSSGPITGEVTNIVTATGDWDGATPAASATATATVTGHDCDIEVTKEASADTICTGSDTLITYTYHVINAGDVELTNVTVSDDTIPGAQAAFEAANGASDTLAVGADIEFTLDANLSATTTNIVTASGDALGLSPADTDTATATVTAVDCDIEVTKEASDDTICTGSDTEITYTYHVINAGDVELTNVTVSDDTIAGAQAAFEAANGGDTLAVGADVIFTLNATLSATTTNIVTASGDALGQSPADTDTATATVTAVDCEIDVTKSPSQDTICAGSDTLITYTYHVINPGDVELTGVTVSDDTIPGAQAAFEAANGASDTLAAGADITFTLDANLSATTTNIVTASGSALGVTATDTATATVTAVDCDIEVTKSPDLTEVCEGSDTLVTYTYHVINAGDVALTGVTVSDDTIPGAQAAFEAANGASDTLAVGADIMFTLTANISTTTTNTVTVTGNALGQNPADTDTASATVTAIPCQVDEGCTPGFWQGGFGVELWDEPNDPDWTAAGGAGTNPFVTTDLFNTGPWVDSGNATVDNMTMLEIVGSGGTNSPARKAARTLIAAYLNASFGLAYPATTAEILADWAAAVTPGGYSFQDFHREYGAFNELGCPIGAPAPAGIVVPLLPVFATSALAYLRRRGAHRGALA